MRTRRTALQMMLAGPLGLLLPRPLWAASPAFPRIPTRNLHKDEVPLPSGFSGSRNVVFLAFARRQQEDIDTWKEPLSALGQEVQGLATWQVTLMGDMGSALRSIVEGAMRGVIRDDAARSRYLLHYGPSEQVTEGLGLASTAEPLVLLLDGSGDELWRGRGVWTAEREAALRAGLSQG